MCVFPPLISLSPFLLSPCKIRGISFIPCVISSAQIFCPDFQPPKQFPVKIPLSLHSISKRSSSPHYSSPSTYTHLGVALLSPVSQTQNHYHFWSFLPVPIFTITPLSQFFLQNTSYLSLFVSTSSLNFLELYVCLVPAEASSWFPQCFQSMLLPAARLVRPPTCPEPCRITHCRHQTKFTPSPAL